MKILITHELFPPDISGGGEKLTLKLAKLLKERGHKVKILTSGVPEIKNYEGISTTRIPINRYLMNLSLSNVLKEAKDVDIIQTSTGNMTFPSWLTAKILKKPVCCHIHHIFGSYWRDVRGPLLGRFFELGERLALGRNFDAVVFQNQNSREISEQVGMKGKIECMIQPGIDWKKFQMKGVEKEPFVLFVGNFDMNEQTIRIKGLEYLLEAAKKLPETNFLIVGGGSEINKMKIKYRKNIIFTGPLVGKTLIEIYNRALIFCFPSLTEGFGISLLEAMSTGCATISTIDIGQEGPKIESKNVEQITNSIRFLINNREKAREIGRKNKKVAKKFTWDKFIKNYIKVYESIT